METSQCCDKPNIYPTRQGQSYLFCSNCGRLLAEIGPDGKEVDLQEAKALMDREAKEDANGDGNGNGSV